MRAVGVISRTAYYMWFLLYDLVWLVGQPILISSVCGWVGGV